ncbi:MAG: hypothetical protein COV45_08515 [Deltaproteobacteria bacterium CG11_big_fil_rev_8_21_14_0_20_47_16]|nr:MAG: hypothetical protein COV45_08515 [Deltaproteobacteria bacterium CG11_big_fil_rev_8_21_14_0_20_47_16]
MVLHLVLLLLIIIANVYLLTCYRRGKIHFVSDLIARMLGVSFYIIYIRYQFYQRLDANIGFESHLQIMSWINWTLVMGLFAFFIIAYLSRANPVMRAKGLRETLLPLICAIMPPSLLETHRLLFLPASWIHNPPKTISWELAAFLFLVLGHLIALVGFLYLGRAFSIMTQARHVVQHGLYRYIRHPVYVGESIATIGIFLGSPSRLNMVLLVGWLVAQRVRASIEERKLMSVFPTYNDYRKRTGAYFPKFW